MKAVLSPPGSGCLPGVPGLAPPAQQGVLALRASCLSLLICDARAGLTLAEEACDLEELHIDILSPQQAETALLARSLPGPWPAAPSRTLLRSLRRTAPACSPCKPSPCKPPDQGLACSVALTCLHLVPASALGEAAPRCELAHARSAPPAWSLSRALYAAAALRGRAAPAHFRKLHAPITATLLSQAGRPPAATRHGQRALLAVIHVGTAHARRPGRGRRCCCGWRRPRCAPATATCTYPTGAGCGRVCERELPLSEALPHDHTAPSKDPGAAQERPACTQPLATHGTQCAHTTEIHNLHHPLPPCILIVQAKKTCPAQGRLVGMQIAQPAARQGRSRRHGGRVPPAALRPLPLRPPPIRPLLSITPPRTGGDLARAGLLARCAACSCRARRRAYAAWGAARRGATAPPAACCSRRGSAARCCAPRASWCRSSRPRSRTRRPRRRARRARCSRPRTRRAAVLIVGPMCQHYKAGGRTDVASGRERLACHVRSCLCLHGGMERPVGP